MASNQQLRFGDISNVEIIQTSTGHRIQVQNITMTTTPSGNVLQVHVTQPIGQETDPVARTFGVLDEGWNLTTTTSPQQTALLRERFQNRRNYAELAGHPEGYEFIHKLVGQPARAVILLTPPDLVAVCYDDGTWDRRARDVATDGPQPYTHEWYQGYLAEFGLPAWFMRMESVICADNDAEAAWVLPRGTANTATYPFNTSPPANYLETRYPATPRYPRQNPFGDGSPYLYQLMSPEDVRLARRFPAVPVNVSRGEERIFVRADQKVVLRHNVNQAGYALQPNEHRMDRQFMRWEAESEDVRCASYVWDDGDFQEFKAPQMTAAFNRAGEIQTARATGLIVDLDQLPAGDGHWGWLDRRVDRDWAAALNLHSPIEVVALREAGGLVAGIRYGFRPITTFQPDARLFNPPRQPTPDGEWKFFTSVGEFSDRALARELWGGTAGVRFNPEPSAEDVWALRQAVQADIAAGRTEDDITNRVNLVWVERRTTAPGNIANAGDPDRYGDTQNRPSTSTSNDDSNDPDIVDPHTGLHHEPRNRDENDQTGARETRQYQTRMINDKKFTVDRGRAYTGQRQPHLMWVCNKNGKWNRWKHANTMDWNDDKLITALNKWREGHYYRSEWFEKRETRIDYTDEQRTWVFARIRAAGGQNPPEGMEQLTRDFNRRFHGEPGVPRLVGAITSLVQRLKKDYATNNGQMKPRKGRGQNKVEEAARRRQSQRQNPEESSGESSEAEVPEQHEDPDETDEEQ